MLFRKIRYILNDYIFEFEIIILDNRNLGYFNYGKKSENYPLLGMLLLLSRFSRVQLCATP